MAMISWRSLRIFGAPRPFEDVVLIQDVAIAAKARRKNARGKKWHCFGIIYQSQKAGQICQRSWLNLNADGRRRGGMMAWAENYYVLEE